MFTQFQKFFSHTSWKNVHWKSLSIFLLLLIMGLFLIALYIPLPSPQMPIASEVLDIHHQPVTTFYLQNRRPVKLDEVPPFMIKAFLAIEDHRFYDHHGINPGRILKAAWYDLTHRRLAQGASTITQQLAKNTYLTQKRTFSRKIKELFYTLKLELHLSKNDILELYLNQIYFGHGAYGIKVAAEIYFQKSLNQLNQAEIALLAGLPKGPSYYSPYSHPEAARKRLLQTLNRMVECNFITREAAQHYAKLPLSLPGLKSIRQPAPYFIDLLQNEVARLFPKDPGIIYSAGLVIESTLDLNMQTQAEQTFLNGLPRLAKDSRGLTQPQGALITVDPFTGEIKALIGGTDYSKSQFNRAIQAKRQPGSAFKPILYATALSKGYTLASLFDRTPKTYFTGTTPYQPLDSQDNTTSGSISLREALACSSNVVAVKLLESIGIESLLGYSAKMGVDSNLPPLLSLALGTGEMTPMELTRAYMSLANGGYNIRPTTIRRILDHEGKVIYESPMEKIQVLNPGVAFLVTQALTGVLQEGGTAANIGHRLNLPAAGKTGTTDLNRDAWFVGYTPDLLTCIFVGCDHYERSLPGVASRVAAPIWADYMEKIQSKNPTMDFAIPKEVVQVNICKETGAKATPFCNYYSEYFLSGTEPSDYCEKHQVVTLRICKRSGLLPGPNCRKIIEKNFSLGEQPVDICDICHPSTKLFEWFRKFFNNKHNLKDLDF